VFSLAVNYLDRVLSSIPVRKSELQLVGTVCMFIASKFKDTVAIPADRLVMYTDYSITVDQLLVRTCIKHALFDIY
jgi:G1/S-specific cyclin-D2